MAFSIIWNQYSFSCKYLEKYMQEVRKCFLITLSQVGVFETRKFLKHILLHYSQIVPTSNEYRSLLMLCFAYQRINFIEHFFITTTPLHKTKFEKRHLEILYGFGYMDGCSRDILETLYDQERKIEFFEREISTSYFSSDRLFLTMTATRKKIDIEASRAVLNLLCYRLRKSHSFFPVVINIIYFGLQCENEDLKNPFMI